MTSSKQLINKTISIQKQPQQQLQQHYHQKLIDHLQNQLQKSLEEIQRLNQLLKANQKQLSQAYFRIAQYKQQQQTHKQYLSLIVVLFAEIESLRNRLNQDLLKQKKQHQQNIQNSKAISKPSQLQDGTADLSLIRSLQCHHQHIIEHNHSLNQLLASTNKHVQLKSQLIPYQLNSPNISKNKQKIQALYHISTYSHQSQSIQSSKTLSSNNSLELSYSSRYKKHQSSPKFVQFESFTQEKPLYKPLKSQRNNLVDLGSFGKISESKNIESGQQVNFKLEESQIVSIDKKNHRCESRNVENPNYYLSEPNIEQNRQNDSLTSSIQKSIQKKVCFAGQQLNFSPKRYKVPLTSSINLNKP